MKIKIKKTERDFTAHYYHANDIHLFRSSVLEFIIKSEKSALMFVDTNSRIKKLTESEIENVLNSCGLNYIKKQIPSTEKKLFGLATFFGGKNKKKRPESLFAIELSSENYSIDLYNSFLMYYDYGILSGLKQSIKDITDIYMMDYSDVMFNKDISETCYYDSVIFTRIRTNSDDSELENNIRLLDV